MDFLGHAYTSKCGDIAGASLETEIVIQLPMIFPDFALALFLVTRTKGLLAVQTHCSQPREKFWFSLICSALLECSMMNGKF